MIVLNNLKKQFINGHDYITAISVKDIKFNKNNFYAVMGPSGSGKSTLLHLISGIEKPDTGFVCVNETQLNNLSQIKSADFRIKNFGLIFQSDNLISELNIEDNLKVIIELSNIKIKDNICDKLLDFFNIIQYKKKYPNQLSSGERQRLALARALLFDPDIIIADEPTSHLDSENAEIVFNFLKKISKKNKIVITASHNNLINKYADKIINLKDGEIKGN